MSPSPPPPQWVVDLNSPPVVKPRGVSIPDPPGFTAAIGGSRVGLRLLN
jgi:ER membrane protein complex subunit 4